MVRSWKGHQYYGISGPTLETPYFNIECIVFPLIQPEWGLTGKSCSYLIVFADRSRIRRVSELGGILDGGQRRPSPNHTVQGNTRKKLRPTSDGYSNPTQ